MNRYPFYPTLFCVLPLILVSRQAVAQGPTIPQGLVESPGSDRSSLLGPIPGDPGRLGRTPEQAGGVLSSRPGVSTPRVPRSIVNPSRSEVAPQIEAIPVIQTLSPTAIPSQGLLAIPEDQKPVEIPGDLSLDEAIELLVRDNPKLQASQYEIPQARADTLTASLRNNPLFYADSNGVPYGSTYSKGRSGSIVYDVNITYPIDLSGKRRARVAAAVAAERVIEALYQDAVRGEIDNLYTVSADILEAAEAVRYYQASCDGLKKALDLIEKNHDTEIKRGRTPDVVRRVRIQLAESKIGLRKAEDDLEGSRDKLSALLGRSTLGCAPVSIRGALHDRPSRPPAPLEVLVGMALKYRPDVVAYRLGVIRAEAEFGQARANRFEDVYLLYQPYSYRTRVPGDEAGITTWAVGLTVPVPLYNRNQGNVQRARMNVAQSRSELSGLEREVMLQVKEAAGDLESTAEAVDDYRTSIVPEAKALLRSAESAYGRGVGSEEGLLDVRGRYNEVARKYLDSLIEHRRSILKLNTAVGQRVMF